MRIGDANSPKSVCDCLVGCQTRAHYRSRMAQPSPRIDQGSHRVLANHSRIADERPQTLARQLISQGILVAYTPDLFRAIARFGHALGRQGVIDEKLDRLDATRIR